MSASAKRSELIGYPDKDWESTTPVELHPSIRDLRNRFFSQAEEAHKLGPSAANHARRVAGSFRALSDTGITHAFKSDLQNWQRRLLAISGESFTKFLQLEKANRGISGGPTEWAYVRVHELLREVLESEDGFRAVKRWIVEYCDGLPQLTVDDLQSGAAFDRLASLSEWRAPLWLKTYATGNDCGKTTAWNRLSENDTEKVLGRIYPFFWAVLEDGLKKIAADARFAIATAGQRAEKTDLARAPMAKKYRSDLKKSILSIPKLTEKSARQVCTHLDAKGVAIPQSWVKRNGDRTFAAAYRDNSTRSKIEKTVSKVKKDAAVGS